MTTIINASTSSGLIQTADTSGTLALQSGGTTQFTVSSTGAYGQLKSATAQASTSGTSIDFTSIPSWVKRITVLFSAVSTSGTNIPIVQIGSGSFIATGYAGSSTYVGGSNVNTANNTGFLVNAQNGAGYTYYGAARLENITGNTWVFSSNTSRGDAAAGAIGNGSLALSGTLDRVRITTVGSTDTFDAGTINIMYEG